MTITCSWSLNIGKEEKVCVWAKWPIRLVLISGVLSIKLLVVCSRNISQWPWQRFKCGPFYPESSALNIRPSHLPTWLGFNYFSFLQNEVTESLAAIFTHKCWIQNLPAVLKSSVVLTSSCDHCIEIAICTMKYLSWFVNINILADVVKLHCKSSTKKSILLQCLFW